MVVTGVTIIAEKIDIFFSTIANMLVSEIPHQPLQGGNIDFFNYNTNALNLLEHKLTHIFPIQVYTITFTILVTLFQIENVTQNYSKYHWIPRLPFKVNVAFNS